MRGTLGGLADELKWSQDAMRDAIRHAMSLGLVEVDEEACYIGLPNFLKYNEPEGPNSVVKAWPQALELIPECGFKTKLIIRCRKYLESTSEKFKKAMGDAICRGDWGVPKSEASNATIRVNRCVVERIHKLKVVLRKNFVGRSALQRS